MPSTVQEIIERLVPDGDCLIWPGRPHKGKHGSTGYARVWFKGRHRYVHRLIYEEAVGPVPEGMEVRHKCNNGMCANIWHLVVGTPLENAQDKEAHGTHSRGERSGKAKLSNEQVIEMRRLYAEGWTSYALSSRYGLDHSAIWRVVTGQRWAHLPGATPPPTSMRSSPQRRRRQMIAAGQVDFPKASPSEAEDQPAG